MCKCRKLPSLGKLKPVNQIQIDILFPSSQADNGYGKGTVAYVLLVYVLIWTTIAWYILKCKKISETCDSSLIFYRCGPLNWSCKKWWHHHMARFPHEWPYMMGIHLAPKYSHYIGSVMHRFIVSLMFVWKDCECTVKWPATGSIMTLTWRHCHVV